MRWLPLLLLAGCAHAPPPPDATIVVETSAPQARVYIDDALAGGGQRKLAVFSGKRRVEIRADGYYTAYFDVEIPRGSLHKLDAPLRKVPPGQPGD
jgi:hypothetical protein